jgi:hypothetical protein
MAKKKYSINMEDGRIVSVEVDGKVYQDVEDIQDPDDRDAVESLVFFAPDSAVAGRGKPSFALPRAILFVFLGVALLMLAITVYSAVAIGRNVAREASAAGRVVEIVGQAGSDGGTFYYPLVEFAAADESRQIVQVGPGSRPPAYRVGDEVTVRYDPTQPAEARIASVGGNLDHFILPLITGVLALAFLLATAFAWWMLRPAQASHVGR